MEQIDTSIRIIDYTEPALRGTTVTLACPTGLRLNGSDTLTCMGNGEWEPDPRKVECKNESIIQTRKGLLSQDVIIAVVSSITVFVVASIVFTIVGFFVDTAAVKQKGSVMLKQLDLLKKCIHTILPTMMIL